MILKYNNIPLWLLHAVIQALLSVIAYLVTPYETHSLYSTKSRIMNEEFESMWKEIDMTFF
jgi:hypothetical protein